MANTYDSIAGELPSLLKNFYEGPIVSQFNDFIPFYKHIEKGSEKFVGAQVVRPVKVLRNNGIGAVAEGGNLPAIGKQTVVQATITSKFNYLRAGITAQMIAASQTDRGAFISALSYEMDEGLNDLKNDFNRQLFWDGTCTLATVSANAISTNVITATGRTSSEDGNKYLQAGMAIDIYSGSTLVASQVGIVSMTGTATVTLTLTAAVTTSANDIIIRAGSFGNELQGIIYSQDGGTTAIFGVNRSTYPVYQGNSVSASSGQLTLNLLQQSYNEARRRGGAKIDAVYTDFTSERYYNKLLIADRRYTVVGSGKVTGDGSFSDKDKSYLEFGGVPVIPDKDSSLQFLFLDSSTWKKYELGPFLKFADETGSELLPTIAADQFELRLRAWANIFPEKPSANARLTSYISP